MASSSTSGSAIPTNAESALDIKILRPTKPGWDLEFIVRSKAKKESSAGSNVYSFRARLDELELAKVMKEVNDHNDVPGWNVVVLTIQKHLRDEGCYQIPRGSSSEFVPTALAYERFHEALGGFGRNQETYRVWLHPESL